METGSLFELQGSPYSPSGDRNWVLDQRLLPRLQHLCTDHTAAGRCFPDPLLLPHNLLSFKAPPSCSGLDPHLATGSVAALLAAAANTRGKGLSCLQTIFCHMGRVGEGELLPLSLVSKEGL